ncbi:MAG: DUF3276 family protein [Paludibacteraceae bacterium]|nr:DUF3276 family protein [Paludibacteraceae bacterium]
MENRKFDDRREAEIVYSRSVKAGKRIYYLDVKKDRTGDFYLCITESKKRVTGSPQVTRSGGAVMGEEAPQFEKHKLFLYKEDFAHFTEGLDDVIAYVKSQVGDIEDRREWVPTDANDTEAPAAATAEAAEEAPAEKKRGLLDRLMGKD